jgi:dienelactone hydrolase
MSGTEPAAGLERVDYADRGTPLTGWLARPSGPARAAFVVFPTIVNVTPAVERRVRMLADAGYVALIADFYGQAGLTFEQAGPLSRELTGDADHFRARLSAAVAALRGHEAAHGLPLAAIGYCMGGQSALELARTGEDLAFVGSFHGTFGTRRKASADTPHKPRVLVCHGDADPLAPREAVLGLWEELDAAGYRWHFHSYSGVRHGFTDPASDSRGIDAIAYDASADRQSWAALMALADEVFA